MHNKCNAPESSRNHQTPNPSPWKCCLLRNRSLMPKGWGLLLTCCSLSGCIFPVCPGRQVRGCLRRAKWHRGVTSLSGIPDTLGKSMERLKPKTSELWGKKHSKGAHWLQRRERTEKGQRGICVLMGAGKDVGVIRACTSGPRQQVLSRQAAGPGGSLNWSHQHPQCRNAPQPLRLVGLGGSLLCVPSDGGGVSKAQAVGMRLHSGQGWPCVWLFNLKDHEGIL